MCDPGHVARSAGHRRTERVVEEDEVMQTGDQRNRQRGRIAMAVLAIAGTLLVVVAAAPAEAKSGGTTVATTINIPAMVVDNLCNLDIVNLSGDLTIRTTTT